MAHLSPSSCGTATFDSPCLPKHAETPSSITSSRRSALVVENHDCLMKYFLRILKDKGYAVRTAGNAEEGLRLYGECGPFNVVLINYWLSPKSEVFIDHGIGQTSGVQFAMAIRDISSSQKMILAAFDYQNEEDIIRPRELNDVQLLIDTRDFQLRKLLDRIEVERAIETLTTAQLLRLRKFADFRVRGLGRAARGRTGEDLLGDALRSTLEGTRQNGEGRRWNRDVDFVTHLAGAMRSISTGWKRKFEEVFLASDVVVYDIEGRETSPLDDVPSSQATPDQCLIEIEDERRIIAMFANDLHAILVLRGIFGDMEKREIVQRLGLTEKQYAAAVKRIRLKLYGRERRSR
jgi:CheY-like chemotaxis protein